MAQVTNPRKAAGMLRQMSSGAPMCSSASLLPASLTTEMVRTMDRDAIVFACANPTPEIFPDDAKAGGAAVVSTGRSDYPNQINNVLAFPGIFRGDLGCPGQRHQRRDEDRRRPRPGGSHLR